MVRKVLLAALLIAITVCSQAQEWEDWIGLYADEGGSDNEIFVLFPESTTAYFVIHAPSFPDGVTAVGFRIPGWPLSGSDGFVTLDWFTGIILGNIPEGIAVAPTHPDWPWLMDENGNAVIGTATFQPFNAGWPGMDLELAFLGLPAEDPIQPAFIDINFNTILVGGDTFWINPVTTPTALSTFSRLKTLY
jgi:hypothetical protein